MKKATKPQVRALDVIITFGKLEEQAAGLYTIWPAFTTRRNNLDRLQEEGLIEWIASHQTNFGERWAVTPKGSQVWAEGGKKAGVL